MERSGSRWMVQRQEKKLTQKKVQIEGDYQQTWRSRRREV